MGETEWDDAGLGQEPGADIGDDGDVPDDALLAADEDLADDVATGVDDGLG